MKYSNDGAIHAWAHNTDSTPSNRNGSIFAIDNVIYSYGHHFPMSNRLENNIFLVTTNTYSVTTSAHIALVRRSIPGKIFNVPNVLLDSFNTVQYVHKLNIDVYIERYNDTLKKASRARSNKEWRLNEALQLASECNDYIDTFKIEHKKIDSTGIDLDNIKKKVIEQEKIKREQEKARQETILKNNKLKIDQWLAGDSVRFPSGIKKVYLRIKGENVETSQGANFPKSHGKLAWKVIKNCIETKTRWTTNGKTIHLGYYKIDWIDINGTLKAGCHTVELDQMINIAGQLGLDRSFL